MKLGDRNLGIQAQIWAVLNILSEGDFSFFGITGVDIDQDKIEKTAKNHDVYTYPFYNFDGHAYGFVFAVKSFTHPDKPVLYFTITQHGSCDNICVMDWLGARDYRNPPMTNQQRPEGARCAHFAFGQAGDVVSYVRVLVTFFLLGMAGSPINTEGVLGIENASSEYGKRVL